MTDIISKASAEAILNPYAEQFGRCLRYGWDSWMSEPAEMRLRAGKRSRACLVSDFFREYGDANWTDEVGLTAIESQGLRLWSVEGRLTVRLKKLRPNLTPSNIPTGQQSLLAIQEPLPGMPPVTNIVAGYVLNPLETDIERMAFVCLVEDRRLWHIDIPEPGAGVVVPHPATQTGPAGSLVRSKRESERERSDDGREA